MSKTNTEKKPFVVDINETYHRQVIVWADDDNEAREIADSHSAEDVIEITCAEACVDRDISVRDITPTNNNLLDILEHYNEEGRIHE